MLELAERLVVEADRAGQDARRGRPDHRGHDRAGIDPAREKRPQRHIAQQADPDRFGDQRVQAIEIFVLPSRIAVAGECQVPVPANGCAAVFGNEEMTGGELADVTIDRLRAGHVQEREIRIQRLPAPVFRHVRILEQRLDFRAERDAGAA